MAEAISKSDWPFTFPTEQLPPEVRIPIERFLTIRAANRAAYRAYSDDEFKRRINDVIASPRELMQHQIAYTETRIDAFNGIVMRDQMPSKRNALIERFDMTTRALFDIFLDPTNLLREVEIPYLGRVEGRELLSAFKEHEAEHEGANRVALTSYGHPLPPEMLKAFGK